MTMTMTSRKVSSRVSGLTFQFKLTKIKVRLLDNRIIGRLVSKLEVNWSNLSSTYTQYNEWNFIILVNYSKEKSLAKHQRFIELNK